MASHIPQGYPYSPQLPKQQHQWVLRMRQNYQQTAMAYYQQHMLSINSRNTLAHILAEYTLINETNQSYRQAIANSPYFDSLALFRLIDHNEKGFISEKDLQNVIGTKHRKLLTYAFTWIDALKTGQVTRLEFAAFLLPRDDLQLRALIAERIEHPQLEQCSKDAVFQQFGIFRQMILEIIKREMKIIELRRQLLSHSDYSVHGSLLAIDNHRHDWVCAEDIEKFMKNYGYHITLRQVEKLVEAMNSSMDGKVSQQQLKWVIQGLQGSDKTYLNRIKQANRKLPPQRPANIEQRFMEYRGRSKARLKDRCGEQEKYSYLMSQLRQVQLQQEEADQSLLVRQRISLEAMKDSLQQQRAQLQARRKLQQQQKQRERLILQAKYKMDQELHQLMHKTALIEADTHRLARIDNRATIHHDLIHNNYHHTQTLSNHEQIYTSRIQYRENRPPSFGPLQGSSAIAPTTKTYLQQYKNGLYKSDHSNTLQHADYTAGGTSYLTRNRMGQSIKQHLQSSDLYLQATRKIKQKIKAERQAERQIREKFSQLPTKYSDHTLPATITSHQQYGTIQLSRHAQAKADQNKMQLGLQSVQKTTSLGSKQGKQEGLPYVQESPQQRAARQSVLQKLDQSTTNKRQP